MKSDSGEMRSHYAREESRRGALDEDQRYYADLDSQLGAGESRPTHKAHVRVIPSRAASTTNDLSLILHQLAKMRQTKESSRHNAYLDQLADEFVADTHELTRRNRIMKAELESYHTAVSSGHDLAIAQQLQKLTAAMLDLYAFYRAGFSSNHGYMRHFKRKHAEWSDYIAEKMLEISGYTEIQPE